MLIVKDPEAFDRMPELGMGYHFGVTEVNGRAVEPLIVLNGLIGLTREDIFAGGFVRTTEQLVLESDVSERQREQVADWLRTIETPLLYEKLISSERRRNIVPSDHVGLFIDAFGRGVSNPNRYQLRERLHESPPFRVAITKQAHFVRFSAFPNDRRVMPDGSLLPGSYVTSALDADHAPSGFAAVGRYALPNPLPAIYRSDIVSKSGTSGLAGTVAPAFGQAGGGAEIELTGGAPPGSVTGPSTIPIY